MRVLNKKLVRDIRASKGQAFAVALVIMCGTASYISVASAHRNLLLTRDSYYAEYRFADFTVMLERAPLSAVKRIAALPGVRQARGRIVKDVSLDIPGEDETRVGRMISMPDARERVINDIALLSGRYFDPDATDEVILSDAFARANGLDIGDRLYATVESRKQSLRIVGTALSPEYVYMIRNVQELSPSPERFGILWVSRTFAESAFNMNEACNDIVGVLNDAADVDAVLDRAEDVLGSYGVYATLTRDEQISNRFLSDEIKGLGVTAKVMPTIFMGIAALILLVLLNRMVRQERTQIGLLKAFGHSNWYVAAHYLKFAMVLGVAGCLLGFATGQWLAGAMINLYVKFFQFPILRSRIYTDVLSTALAITLCFAAAGAFSAARRAARIRPAEAMRPETPRYASRTFIERSAFLWRRLSFSWKMIVRNVSRYRFRAALSVFGVMVSSGIMVVGFFSMDSMRYMMDFQFTKAQREDVRVSLWIERGRDAYHAVRRLDYVRRAEPLLEYPFELRAGWRTKDVGITGLTRDTKLLGLIDTQGRAVDVGERGLVLSQRLANDLGVKAGDIVIAKPLKGRITEPREIRVSKVVQQYLGASAYMNIDALSRILDESFAMNAALLDTENGKERALNASLKDVVGVAAVEIKEDARAGLEATLEESMRISNVFMSFFAGVIAFSIIYNSTLVSLAERERELASLRVMGFTNGEVGGIVYNENFLLSAFGLLLGLPFGVGLSRLIVIAYDTELYRLPFHISGATFAKTCALTVLFVALANLAARRRVRKLDMVETLKARE